MSDGRYGQRLGLIESRQARLERDMSTYFGALAEMGTGVLSSIWISYAVSGA